MPTSHQFDAPSVFLTDMLCGARSPSFNPFVEDAMHNRMAATFLLGALAFSPGLAAARAEATQHESMGRVYSGGKFFQRSSMQAHCKKIAAKKSAIANEYEVLAKLHEDEGKRTQ